MPQALVLDDDRAVRTAVAEVVRQEGFSVLEAGDLSSARAHLEAEPIDLALLDIDLPDGTGLELIPDLNDLPRVDVIVISGEATVDLAVEAFRAGVLDFMTKPVEVPQLRELLAKTRRTAALADEIRKLRGELRALGRFGRMVGGCAAMQEVYDWIAKVAPTEGSVFVIGETGTGKELVAATVHDLSRRADRPYLPVNCGAIAPNLIESELFGHEKGAFTGADRVRKGLFERAEGGTLFLDEITEMPIELQVKLLRTLESGEYQRVGGDRIRKSDVRVIAATNRDPEIAVKDGVLREDLMYRLLVFPIRLPPLRDRGSDVVLLADHFLAIRNNEAGTRKRLSPGLIDQLRGSEWPGNVRELKHAIDRAFLLAGESRELPPLGEALSRTGKAAGDPTGRERSAGSADGPASSSPTGGDADSGGAVGVRVGDSIAEAEKKLILATLEREPDKKKAAETLGVSLKTLYARLQRYRAEKTG